MKTRRILLLATVLAACVSAHCRTRNADSLAIVKADWHVLQCAKGITVKSTNLTMFGAKQNISVIVYDPRRFRTCVAVTDTLTLTTRMAQSRDADYAVNGSFFDFAGPALTLCKDGKRVVCDTPMQGKGRNNWGVLTADSITGRVECFVPRNEDIGAICSRSHYVLASYPMLLVGGKSALEPCDTVQSKFNNRNPRTFMGISRKGEVMLVVVDGRAEGNAEGMTFTEEVKLARWMGMKTALNLDGGGSSTLWTRRVGIVNCPTDNHRFDHEGERKVSNIVYLRRR